MSMIFQLKELIHELNEVLQKLEKAGKKDEADEIRKRVEESKAALKMRQKQLGLKVSA